MDRPSETKWSLADRTRIARGWVLCRASAATDPAMINFGFPGLVVAIAGLAWYGALHLPETILRSLNGS